MAQNYYQTTQLKGKHSSHVEEPGVILKSTLLPETHIAKTFVACSVYTSEISPYCGSVSGSVHIV